MTHSEMTASPGSSDSKHTPEELRAAADVANGHRNAWRIGEAFLSGILYERAANNARPMSDPNDKQKCGTCDGHPQVWNIHFGAAESCPSCAPRADGSAAEVKRYMVYEGRTRDCPDYYVDEEIIDEEVVLASAYDAVIAERDRLQRAVDAADQAVAKVGRDNARLESRVAELERVSTKLATALASNIGLQLSDCNGGLWDEYRAALSKGAQT